MSPAIVIRSCKLETQRRLQGLCTGEIYRRCCNPSLLFLLSQFFFQIVDILKSTASSGHLSQVGETQMAENIEPGEEKQPGR
jgi:hypothetical protein